MYKIYFDKRLITICSKNQLASYKQEKVLYCKNKKSFDNAYNLFLIDLSITNLVVYCDNTKKIFKHLKHKYLNIKAAGGIVLNENKELLIIKRHGYWDLPKGKVEKGEGKKQAAIREVEEECGIIGLKLLSKVAKTYHTYQFKGKNHLKASHWYLMSYGGVEKPVPQEEEDITEVKWLPMSEIETVLSQTYESLKPLFQKVLNHGIIAV